MSSSYEDTQRRREAFQREQLRQRLHHADKVRSDSQQRQDARDARRRDEAQKRDNARAIERSKNYETKRADKLADDAANSQLSIEEQQEITRREVLLAQIGARVYRDKLNADYSHDVRTRNLDMEEHIQRSDIDTRHTIKIANNAARNELKSYVIQQVADFVVSEHAKHTASQQELVRMEKESLHRTTEIREESSAREREIWTENEAKKDYELFMANLRQQTNNHTTDEIAAILKKLEDLP